MATCLINLGLPLTRIEGGWTPPRPIGPVTDPTCPGNYLKLNKRGTMIKVFKVVTLNFLFGEHERFRFKK